MRRTPLFWSGTAAAVVVALVLVVLVVDRSKGDTIADGVRIGSVDVGGLDRDAARERVRSEIAPKALARVDATHGGRTYALTPEQADAAVDVEATVDEAIDRGRAGSNVLTRTLGTHDAVGTVVEPRVTISERAIERFATRVAEDVDEEPRDADIDWVGGKLEKTKARSGLKTQRAKLVAAVTERMRAPAEPRRIEVPVSRSEKPDETLTDLAEKYPKVVTVDRAGKRLRLYRDLKLERTYDVAVGKQGNETTPGRYKVQSKQTDPVWNVPQSDWAGDLAGQTIPAGDPRNPLVARWMGFNGSQGIHGTDELDSLGETASHGCIRMAEEDVTALYDEVDQGTPVFVQ